LKGAGLKLMASSIFIHCYLLGHRGSLATMHHVGSVRNG